MAVADGRRGKGVDVGDVVVLGSSISVASLVPLRSPTAVRSSRALGVAVGFSMVLPAMPPFDLSTGAALMVLRPVRVWQWRRFRSPWWSMAGVLGLKTNKNK